MDKKHGDHPKKPFLIVFLTAAISTWGCDDGTSAAEDALGDRDAAGEPGDAAGDSDPGPELPGDPPPDSGPDADDAATVELDQWGEQFQRNLDSKRHGVESLQKAGDMTVLQLLDALEKAKDKSATEDHFPGADTATEPATTDTVPLRENDVGDS